MDIDKIMELIDKVDKSGISSLTVEEGCLKISIEKNKGQAMATEGSKQVVTALSQPDGAVAGVSAADPAALLSGAAAGMSSADATASEAAGASASPAGLSFADAAAFAGATQAGAGSVSEAPGVYITSPIVGMFYTSSGPDEAPFVKVGDTVKAGQVVGIVEAMKLMNEIESDVDGVIEEILVENAQGVEYGQPLFRIK